MLMFLLDNYANVNSKDKDGMTPLHYACLNNHADIVYMLLNKKFNQKGVTIALNETNSNGNTPLHIAASKNNFVIIDKLITVGANTTIKNHDGKIPRDLTSSKEDYDMIVNF